jgi:hypothetical protein
MGVFFSFSLGLTMELGVPGCCDFWPRKRKEKETGVRAKVKNLDKRFGCRFFFLKFKSKDLNSNKV